MRQIVCFGDSNTYGLIPKEGGRYPWGVRWTSRLNERLGLDRYRVIEEGLCGRTTIFDDLFRENRNGSKWISGVVETSGESDLIIVMLGTNDCKTAYGASAELIGKGVRKIIHLIRQYAGNSEILLISPIHLGEQVWKPEYDPEFSKASVQVSRELAEVYRRIAAEEQVHFLAASDYAKPSETDQEHLNEEEHKKLADAVYEKVCGILERKSVVYNRFSA